MKSNKPLSRKKDLLTQETNGEVMVYDLKTDKAFCLNETSAIIWELCNGENSISDISAGLGKKLKSSASEDLVWLAIDQLKKDNLIANSEELENVSFEGMSRRDVIKKVGMGTMIALPIIAGLTAPKAVNAASTCSAPAGNTNLCACSAAAGPGQVGTPCTYNDARVCPAGCGPTYFQQGSAVCTCA